MSNNFADRLLAAIDQKGAPICVGIDPIFDMLPDAAFDDDAPRDPKNAETAVDAIFNFCLGVLRTVAPHVPIVKFQSAYFEKYLWEGVETYYSLIQEAKALGLLVIGDIKRGDIGSTASAYCEGHLAQPIFSGFDKLNTPDAVTVNPFCGLDTIVSFVETCRTQGKGMFVLVRTSNPGSGELQDVKLADGKTWSEMLAERLHHTAAQPGLIGSSNFSSVGAVVGATQPQTMVNLRQRLPQSIFLLPGYGAQGATADMTRAAFSNGRGGLISASRSILYAHREAKYAEQARQGWEKAVEQAVLDMKADVAGVLKR